MNRLEFLHSLWFKVFQPGILIFTGIITLQFLLQLIKSEVQSPFFIILIGCIIVAGLLLSVLASMMQKLRADMMKKLSTTSRKRLDKLSKMFPLLVFLGLIYIIYEKWSEDKVAVVLCLLLYAALQWSSRTTISSNNQA